MGREPISGTLRQESRFSVPATFFSPPSSPKQLGMVSPEPSREYKTTEKTEELNHRDHRVHGEEPKQREGRMREISSQGDFLDGLRFSRLCLPAP